MAETTAEQMVDALIARSEFRAGSLIVTLFGDSISPHGNSVWLGSVIEILAAFGLNPRQIRTAVFRLAQEGWLATTRVGRRSYYSFTATGLRRYEKAARRVYAAGTSEWKGRWTLVIAAQTMGEQRERLRRELLWLGYAPLLPGLFAHPAADETSLRETLQDLGLVDEVIVLSSKAREAGSNELLKYLVHDSLNLHDLDKRYRRFVADFQPILDRCARQDVEPSVSFRIRTLLIHEYRRILLHDTDLPEALLPADWSGAAAWDLTRALYQRVHRGTMEYLTEALEMMQQESPAAARSYWTRFGGLPRASAV